MTDGHVKTGMENGAFMMGNTSTRIRKKLDLYTEVYIVFIFVYFHVILPYLVSTLLDYILYTSPASVCTAK